MRKNVIAVRDDARAIIGGFVGMVAMGIFAYLIAPAAGLPKLDFGSWIGTLFLPAGTTAMVIGLVIALLAGLIWALLYERVVRAVVAGGDWLGGTIWGLIAWLLAGVILGVSGTFHPRIAAGQIANPGFFGLALGGWMMPVSIFLAFLVYGVVLGLVYELFTERQIGRAAGPATA